MQVREGYEATLFDGPDYTGESRILTGKTPCLVDLMFNDRMSSLRIRAMEAPDAGGAGGSGGASGTGGAGGNSGAPAGGADAGVNGADAAPAGCTCRMDGGEEPPSNGWLWTAAGALLAGRRRRRS